MEKEKYIMLDDPEEVIAQIDTMGYLLGQLDTKSTISEKTAHGLSCLVYMIGENAKSMIAKLMKEAAPEA